MNIRLLGQLAFIGVLLAVSISNGQVPESPHEVLGLPATSSEAQIKSAYRKLAMKFHPDHNPGDKLAEDRFKEIADAYEKLTSGSGQAGSAIISSEEYFEQIRNYHRQISPYPLTMGGMGMELRDYGAILELIRELETATAAENYERASKVLAVIQGKGHRAIEYAAIAVNKTRRFGEPLSAEALAYLRRFSGYREFLKILLVGPNEELGGLNRRVPPEQLKEFVKSLCLPSTVDSFQSHWDAAILATLKELVRKPQIFLENYYDFFFGSSEFSRIRLEWHLLKIALENKKEKAYAPLIERFHRDFTIKMSAYTIRRFINAFRSGKTTLRELKIQLAMIDPATVNLSTFSAIELNLEPARRNQFMAVFISSMSAKDREIIADKLEKSRQSIFESEEKLKSELILRLRTGLSPRADLCRAAFG